MTRSRGFVNKPERPVHPAATVAPDDGQHLNDYASLLTTKPQNE